MKRIGILFGFAAIFSLNANAQNDCDNISAGGAVGRADCDQANAITTAVPFLLISPDSRSSALGDAGVALSTDANSQHWNASKLAFSEEEIGVSLSYSPWLRQLVDDMSLTYLAGFMKLNKTSAIGASLRYFTLGNITFTDVNGQVVRDFEPAEFAVDVSYSIQLSDQFAGGITARWINSNLTGGVNVGGADSRAANAFAVDVSGFYQNDISVGDKDAELALGMVISNIGNKISYTNTSQRDFLPTNLRIGGGLKVELDAYNTVAILYDANKLLVPTPPIYDPEDPTFIVAGSNPDVGVAAGIFQSFGDAPGNVLRDGDGNLLRNPDGTAQVDDGSVFREELREINHSVGLEYWYAEQFAVRGGFFYEPPTKGNRKYFTIGAGFRYNVFGLDLSYLIPTEQRNPLANTLRFSLVFNFNSSGPGVIEEND